MVRRDPVDHSWQFFRAGDFEQVSLATGADLMALRHLDQKLWAALGCPVHGLYFDTKTLELIDSDRDGRIRAPELIAAIEWAGALLKSPEALVQYRDALPLDAIDDSTEAGAAMAAAMRHVLELLGKEGAATISVEETDEAQSLFSKMAFNGDGIIPGDVVTDAELRSVIDDIVACLGSDTDLSGAPGISGEKLTRFLQEAEALSNLIRQADDDPSIRPIGEKTAAAAAAIEAVRAKVTDYFTRCRLAEFDARAVQALNRVETEYLALSAAELTPAAAEISAFPMSHVEPGKPLGLTQGINPAWEDAVRQLREAAIAPLLGDRDELTYHDWQTIEAKIAPFAAWNREASASALSALPIERVRAILDSDAGEKLALLIGKDLAKAGTAEAIHNVDRLARYCRHLHLLCENFVNFKHFYNGGEMAIFQAGTLYLDQRSCELTLVVDEAAKQAPMVAMAGTFLLYCDCRRKTTGETRHIVAAVTNGDADNLMVGRNGVYYDRDGRDWDATITKIIDNPISLREAFWAPYKKLVRLIEEQVAKRAAAAEAASSEKMESAAAGATALDQAKQAEAKKIDVGTVAALGVAFGAIATAIAAIAGYGSGLMRLPFWQLCIALGLLLVTISGPSMVIAWLKLRKRNLGPILDANGWAVNARARINIPFGASLTGIAQLPRGSRIAAGDRFGQRPAAWPKVLLLVVILGFLYSLLNYYGVIDRITGGAFGSPAGSQPGFEILLPDETPEAAEPVEPQ